MSVDETSNEAPEPGIFISHRSGDASFAAAYVHRTLVNRFGERSVFYAARGAAPGTDFETALTEAARHARVVIVLIGPTWLTATDEHGLRRIDRRTDWVRREIEAATQAGAWIIPVLLEGAKMMSEQDLPSSLATLAHRQALRLDPAHADSTISKLADTIVELLPEATAVDRPRAMARETLSGAELVAAITESARRDGRSVTTSLKIRREPVREGPIRDFFDRLHELHRWAGEPSTRTMASNIGKGVVSYGTIYAAFRGPRVPRWGHVELIVEELGGDIDIFRQAWVDARDAEDDAHEAS